jgi:Na+/H+ antiporter
MEQAELFVALLVAVVLVALAARRLRRIPDAVALVLGGIGAGLLPFAPEVRLEPDVIFVVFLPPILYPSAFTFAAEDVRTHLRPITFLAFGLVLATVAVIGVALHAAAGVPWAAAFTVGAVLAPTDPVAATAVIRSSGAPARLATILEGESLINDGTGLTAFRIVLAAVGGTFALGSAAADFILVAFGGAAVGASLAYLTSKLRRRIDDLELESTIGVLLAYGAFILAERLGVSGVLAVVLAGYVMGSTEGISSPDTRVRGESFWAVAQFLSESILFLLVGISFAEVLEDPATRGPWEIAGLTALVVTCAVATRMAWMFSVPYLAGLLRPGRRGLAAMMSASERAVIGFAGLRGALSVAAALSIPGAVDGTGFPERTTIVAICIASIVVLLVGPALSLPAVLGLLGLHDADEGADAERRARAALADAALAATEEDDEGVPEEVLARVRERYEVRLRRNLPGDDDDTQGVQRQERVHRYRELQRRAVQAQRDRLAQLRRDGTVHGQLLRTLEHELDIEELRTRR